MDNNKEGFGFQFWTMFIIVSSILVFGGLFCSAISIRHYLIHGGLTSLVSVVFGILSFVGGIFCMRLLPKWAKLVRNTRLSEERLKGVLGAANISQYIQADEERGRNLMDSISQKQEEVGRNLAKRMDSRWDNTTLLIRKSNEMMEALKSSLADVNKKLASMADPAELERYKREAQRLEKENRMLRASDVDLDEVEERHETAPTPRTDVEIEESQPVDENPVDSEDDQDAEPLGFISDEDEQKWKDGEEEFESDGDVSTYW